MATFEPAEQPARKTIAHSGARSIPVDVIFMACSRRDGELVVTQILEPRLDEFL